jgi:hypothetical protein
MAETGGMVSEALKRIEQHVIAGFTVAMTYTGGEWQVGVGDNNRPDCRMRWCVGPDLESALRAAEDVIGYPREVTHE